MPQIVSNTYYSLTRFEFNRNNTKVACCCWSALYRHYYVLCGVFALKTLSACVIFLLCMAFGFSSSFIWFLVFFSYSVCTFVQVDEFEWHAYCTTHVIRVWVNKQRKSRLISAQFLRLLNGMSNNGKIATNSSFSYGNEQSAELK